LMPNLSNWRPCDTIETAVAWRAAIERQGPTCLMLSRQALPFQERDAAQLALVQRGGYVLLDLAEDSYPDAILIATGSEVALAIDAAKQLQADEIYVRVVSMPSTDVFLAQDEKYREEVLPMFVLAKVAVEASVGIDWYRFVGTQGKVVGLNRCGASAPAKDVYRDCGITVDQVVAITKEVIYSVASSAHHVHAKCASG
jgi:transketolase